MDENLQGILTQHEKEIGCIAYDGFPKHLIGPGSLTCDRTIANGTPNLETCKTCHGTGNCNINKN